MNINELTVGEVKQIAALVGGGCGDWRCAQSCPVAAEIAKLEKP